MKENFDQVIKMKGQVVTMGYRFRAKNNSWIWLRTSSFAFLNPYTDEIEYIVLTNSLAKSVSETATGSLVASTVAGDQYRTPAGLDYSLPGPGAPRQDMYGSQSAAAAAVYSYDPTPSPVAAYGSPGVGVAGGRGSVGKASGSPTPPQSAWSQPGSTPGPESYGGPYSGMSPARSPCPTTGGYRAPPPPGPAPSMWPQWQNNNGDLSAPPPTSETGVDMLSMLGAFLHLNVEGFKVSLFQVTTGRALLTRTSGACSLASTNSDHNVIIIPVIICIIIRRVITNFPVDSVSSCNIGF